MTSRRGQPLSKAYGSRLARILAATAAGLGLACTGTAGGTPLKESLPTASAMAGTEDYCNGYERTFHGEWTGWGGAGASGTPILFRIGANAGGEGCYAQLNVMAPPGVAPYELPRFRAEAQDGTAWTLRYGDIVLSLDPGSETAVRRQGTGDPWTGVLRARPPAIAGAQPAPSTRQMERWNGKWTGRFADLPLRVTLRLSPSGANEVTGRISTWLGKKSFTGRFHGELLVFRWKNRHVGLVMEPGGDTLVYTDYKGRIARFRRPR